LKNENIDPRFKYVARGSAPYVEWLGIQENPEGKGWAAGAGYGEKILTILSKVLGVTEESTSEQEIKALSGYVRVIYKGEDGLNVRAAPSFGDNIDQVVHEGTFTVVGISADGAWYKLKSGLFITIGKQYVEFLSELPGAFTPYKVRISIPDLNIRKDPGTDCEKWGIFTGVGVFTIVEEAVGVGATKWGLLKSYADKRNGWISLDYAEKI